MELARRWPHLGALLRRESGSYLPTLAPTNALSLQALLEQVYQQGRGRVELPNSANKFAKNGYVVDTGTTTTHPYRHQYFCSV